MYPKELENLLKEYLTDGVITDNEREILRQKAESLGVNVKEFDLYIDAQVQKIQQKAESAMAKLRGQTCPYCGGSVPMLTDKCPHCGELISLQASNELKQLIDDLETSLRKFKDPNAGLFQTRETKKTRCEEYIHKAQIYYGNNPKVMRIVQDVTEQLEISEKKQKKAERLRLVIALASLVVLLVGLLVVLPVVVALCSE